MDSKQTKIVLAVMILVLAAWILSLWLFSYREQAWPLSSTASAFDESRAYRLTRDFVTQYPIRTLGSIESRQATGYIHDHLEKLGYSVSYSHFDARIARRKQVGRNVLGYKEGQSPEILALVAHLDTATTTVQGAMDNGSGVGVLLELARIFASERNHRSLLIIFSDGAEWGSLGARDLADSYPERNRIVAVLSLDHVASGELSSFCLEATGQLKGFAPPWLRRLARDAAQSEGIPAAGASGFSEYLERAFLVSWADQGPFLSAGIPSINLGSESKDRKLEKEIYHSARDTVEKLKPASVGAYGSVAERIVRTLDSMPSMPSQSPAPFRLWDVLFLRPAAVSALQFLLFLPTALVFFFHVKGYFRQLKPILVGREILAFVGTVLPFWAIYPSIALSRALRLIPTYTLYPATLKDPVLENPPWGILAGIAGISLFVGVICYVLAKFSFTEIPKPSYYSSKAVLMAFLLIGAGLSLSYNFYWATLFFALPAWIWALVGMGNSARRHARDSILIVAAGIPYFAVLGIYGSRLNLSWNFIWYQALALGNGLFTGTAFLLATSFIALGIRFLAIQSHEKIS
jgi:hypothetical protein